MGLADTPPESVLNSACIDVVTRFGVENPDQHVFRNISPIDTESDITQINIPYPLMVFRRFGEPDPVKALDEYYQQYGLFIVRAVSTNILSRSSADVCDLLTDYLKEALNKSGRLDRFSIQTDEENSETKTSTRISVCAIEQWY